ncbi:DUF6693 family protein [Yoonia sp. BS5-3]|uniref:DUF6693 family protein n=1 Tax=Yoonia phaeophyticola TaxID=3137369 RepID=A0ABZ2V8D8_9RHOB
MLGCGLKCEYSVSEAIGQLVIWFLLIIVTLGLALFVLPYYFLKGPINKTFVVDQNGDKLAQLHVDVNLGEIIGHMIIWIFLSIVTLGFAYLIYWPAVMKKMLSGVKYKPLGQAAPASKIDHGPIISSP